MDAPRPTSELAADVEALREACAGWPQPNHYDAALDALVARVTDLEARANFADAVKYRLRAEAAEAQVAALTQELERKRRATEGPA